MKSTHGIDRETIINVCIPRVIQGFFFDLLWKGAKKGQELVFEIIESVNQVSLHFVGYMGVYF